MGYSGINVVRHKLFVRDFKKLSKKYRSLKDDLRTFIATSIRAVHVLGQNPESMGHFPIQGLGKQISGVYIAKRFACKSLKGTGSRSGIRVVYSFDKEENQLLLIEIFYKGDKQLPDLDRVNRILSI